MVKATLNFVSFITLFSLAACANLRRAMRDDSSNIVTVVSPDGLATASTTTKNNWVEEGTPFTHIRVRFENVDSKKRAICGINFSIEGFDPADPRAQYGNFEVLPNGELRIPGVSSASNPLHYSTLMPNQRPDWFIGLIFPFSSTTHEFPSVAIHKVDLCTPNDTEASTNVTAAKVQAEEQQQP